MAGFCATTCVLFLCVFIHHSECQDLCTDTCNQVNDYCEDGGQNAMSGCEYGTDCTDCGPRDSNPDDIGCWNTCYYADDGGCDDGLSSDDGILCQIGTDCVDCGPRDISLTDGLCNNDCEYSEDIDNGVCDDGGPGAVTTNCIYGNDCYDCGHRPLIGTVELCSDTCMHANNGLCEDGGLLSYEQSCFYGTDCYDCGIRYYDNGTTSTSLQRISKSSDGISWLIPLLLISILVATVTVVTQILCYRQVLKMRSLDEKGDGVYGEKKQMNNKGDDDVYVLNEKAPMMEKPDETCAVEPMPPIETVET